MAAILKEIVSELADNWPAFVYIAMTIIFSILFFRERRAERKIIDARFDRIESLLRGARPPEPNSSRPSFPS